MRLRRGVAPDEIIPDLSFRGGCTICGHEGVFGVSPDRNPVDREFRCGACRYPLRFQDEAQVLIDEFGDGRQLSLAELLLSGRLLSQSVYHIGSQGPVRNRLRVLPEYQESRFEPDSTLGSTLPDGFRNEDVERLTFADASFDLIVSSHVLEHVPDPWEAFAEFRRVLRPRGRMIHSIPSRFPFPDATIARAEMDGGTVVHHLDAQYHQSPEGVPALVFTDFGADVCERLESLGFEAVVRRPHLPVSEARRNAVIVARRV